MIVEPEQIIETISVGMARAGVTDRIMVVVSLFAAGISAWGSLSVTVARKPSACRA